MSKLSMGDGVGPRGGLVPTENAEACFNFLVDALSFSVSLWVIGSGEGEVILKNSS